MAGDPFTSSVFAWLNRVAADNTLPAAAFKLAYVISQHINRRSLKAWPSQETLADSIGVDVRQVQRLVKALAGNGYLRTTRRKHQSMIYELAQDLTEMSRLEGEAENEPASTDEPRHDISDVSCDQDPTFQASRPDIFGHQDPTEMSPKPLNEPLKNQRGGARARGKRLPLDFGLDRGTYDWALSKLGSDEAVEHSMFRFTNHYRQAAGDRGHSNDWLAKARLWIDDDARKQGEANRRSAHAAIGRLRARIEGPGPDGTTEEGWRQVIQHFAKHRQWTRHGEYGPAPGQPGCFAPRHLLIEFGLEEHAA